MCGICGIVRLEGIGENELAAVSRMTTFLSHRGPDGNGVWFDNAAALGHARLSIIDIECGAQPMIREDLGLAVVFNGEIYNYRELRLELEARGIRFNTNSDTEVLLLGYNTWGESVFERLNGMFAVGLRDARRDVFILARDRFGEKPFYIFEHPDGRVFFSSEVKALFASPDTPRRFNEDAFVEYLAFRAVTGGHTLFRGIEELPAATVRTYSRDRRTQVTFWTPDVPLVSNVDLAGKLKRIESLLYQAAERRLIADVPVGTMLSGGIDSSLVTAMAVKAAGTPLDTFCVGFNDPALDERAFARETAIHVGSRHHELVVSDEDMLREIEPLTWAHDFPMTHPNAIPIHLILRFAKDEIGIKVVLSGEGADELFGGYAWYEALSRRPRFLSPSALHLISRAVPPVDALRAARRVFSRDYPLEANAVTPWKALEALGLDVERSREDRRALIPKGRSVEDAMYIFDQRTYLPPLLHRQDRMSMAAGVEARVVFLDHLLAEAINSIPHQLKQLNGTRKGLLRSIAKNWLPASTLERKKVGFVLPLSRWLSRGGALFAMRDRLHDSKSISGSMLGRNAIEQLANADVSEDPALADLLWSCVALETWREIFLDGSMKTFRLSGAARVMKQTEAVAAE